MTAALDLIGKLLAKAESTTNAHEQAAFMQKAQLLASQNSITLAKARATHLKNSTREVPEYRRTSVGERGARNLRWYIWLYNAIAHNNDVKITFASDSTFIEAIGFPSDLDVVDALYSSLLTQMVTAANDYIASGAHRAETVERYDRKLRRYVDRPVHASTARTEYYRGWIATIADRLSEARTAAEDEASVADQTLTGDELLPITTAIALRDKRDEVDAEYQRHTRRIGGVRAARWSTTRRADGARNAGRTDARDARLTERAALGA